MALLAKFIRSFSLEIAENIQYWALFDLAYTNKIQSSNYKFIIVHFSRIENEYQNKTSST